MTITDPTMAAAKNQISQGIVMQAYCNSVLEQPQVDFSGFTNLMKYQSSINAGLVTAKAHATNYLTNIQPAIITNISNINNYYQLYNSVPYMCPSGSSVDTWINAIKILQKQAITYSATSQGIVTNLGTLNVNLGSDVALFSGIVINLNAAVNGDNGVMGTINDNINTIDQQIGGCIAGTVLSGLAIVGGIFMIAVGGIADFVTAGTTTPLVIAGVGVLAIGISGEAASAITLKNLYSSKASLLQQKSSLTSEVNLALGMSSGYVQLNNQAKSAMNAATQMQNAWSSLNSDLGNMAADLQNGIQSADGARTLWLAAANGMIPTILSDISTIKAQMAGVQCSSSGSTNLGTYIQQLAKAA